MSARSSIIGRTIANLDKVVQESKNVSRRVNSVVHGGSIVSRYAPGMIPTENLKFEQFCQVLFNSKMEREQIQTEVISYVRDLETNYNSQIQNL